MQKVQKTYTAEFKRDAYNGPHNLHKGRGVDKIY